jgi:hypothetical protein
MAVIPVYKGDEGAEFQIRRSLRFYDNGVQCPEDKINMQSIFFVE